MSLKETSPADAQFHTLLAKRREWERRLAEGEKIEKPKPLIHTAPRRQHAHELVDTEPSSQQSPAADRSTHSPEDEVEF